MASRAAWPPAPPPPPRAADELDDDDYGDDGEYGTSADGGARHDDYLAYSDEEDYADEDGSGAYDDELYSDDGASEGQEIVVRQERPFAPERPLPVDVWRARHEVPHDVKPVKKIGAKDMAGLVERLNDSSRQKQLFIMRVQQRQMAAELKDLKFAPRICKKSRELAANRKDLTERTLDLITKRDRDLMRVKTEQDQRELNDATFRPDIKTPCVCGKGKGLRESTVDEMKRHTLYCQKFMKSCESLNRTSTMQIMSDKMKRHVNHLMQYEENKKIRALQRRQIIQEVEDKELTFSPRINQKSLDLLAQEPTLRKSLKKSDFATLPHHKLPGHEQESFSPAINKRSSLVGAGASGSAAPGEEAPAPVFQRLYKAASAKSVSRKATITDYTRQFVNTSVDTVQGIDLGVGFHSDLEAAAQATGMSGPATSSPAFFNVVRYDPKFDFINRRLQKQALYEEARM